MRLANAMLVLCLLVVSGYAVAQEDAPRPPRPPADGERVPPPPPGPPPGPPPRGGDRDDDRGPRHDDRGGPPRGEDRGPDHRGPEGHRGPDGQRRPEGHGVTGMPPGPPGPHGGPGQPPRRDMLQHNDGGMRSPLGPGMFEMRLPEIDIDFTMPAPHRIMLPMMHDKELRDLMEQDGELTRETAELAQRLRRASGEDKASVKEKLADTVKEHFTVRQAKRKRELQLLQDRLNELKASIDGRDAKADEIIQQRVNELTGDGPDLRF